MWGPLWANSSFVYEDTIGTLLEMFNGTQAVPEHICKRFFNTKTLMHHTELFNNASDDVCDLFNKLVNKDNTVLKSYKVGSGARVVGNYTTRVITVGESILFGNYIEASVKEFKRCFIHHTLYTTEMYAANFKRNNSCVALKNGEHGSIKSILLCKLNCGCLSACKCEEVYLYIFRFKKDSRQLRIYDDFAKVNTAKQIVKFRKTHEILLCKPNDILCKCFCYVHDESIILIKMPVLENV
jgi:glycosyltransferase involved in cell wall biosynthesis